MNAEKFEDLIMWKKAVILAKDVYCAFENSRDFGFNDQIQRAAVSVSNNIAEGFERKSGRQFHYFLEIAKGSCGEVRSMLYLALVLEKISESQFKDLLDQTKQLSKLLQAFSKRISH